ncbi:hypothetical protein BH09PSE2_BH09PSE2_20740 [soil metagenome]
MRWGRMKDITPESKDRYEDQKPDDPPRPSTEPAGGGRPSPKTQTDPATGTPTGDGEGSEKA